MSGGQRQRIAVARCLIQDAKILLCDEPTSSLDENNAYALAEILAEISKKVLVIVATHFPSLFRSYDSVRLSNEDGIVQESEVREVKENKIQTSFEKPRSLKLHSMLAIAKSFFRKSKPRLIMNMILTAISLTAFSAMTSAMMMDSNKVLLNRQLQDGNPFCVFRQFQSSVDVGKTKKVTSLEEHMKLLEEIEAHPIFSLSELMGFSQRFMDASVFGPFTSLINSNFSDNSAIELWDSGNDTFLTRDTRLNGNENCHMPKKVDEIALSSFYAEALMRADDGGLSLSGGVEPGPFLGLDDVNQLIGRSFHGFIITDVYSTKEDKRVMPLLEEGKQKQVGFRTAASFLYVCPGFLEKKETESKNDINRVNRDYAFLALGNARYKLDDSQLLV